MIPRRGLLAGLGALLAAPAIIRTPGLLMPVKPPPALSVTDRVHPVTESQLNWALGREMSEFEAFFRRSAEEMKAAQVSGYDYQAHVVSLMDGEKLDITDRLLLRIGGKG